MTMTTTILQLEGLTCAACQKVITKKISKIPDVENVVVELSGETKISSSRQIDKQEVMNVLEETHYKVV